MNERNVEVPCVEARYGIIHIQCSQLVTIDRTPDAGVMSSLAEPDSNIT